MKYIVVLCSAVWSGVVWCGVVWCGVVWCGVECGVWSVECDMMWCVVCCGGVCVRTYLTILDTAKSETPTKRTPRAVCLPLKCSVSVRTEMMAAPISAYFIVCSTTSTVMLMSPLLGLARLNSAAIAMGICPSTAGLNLAAFTRSITLIGGPYAASNSFACWSRASFDLPL